MLDLDAIEARAETTYRILSDGIGPEQISLSQEDFAALVAEIRRLREEVDALSRRDEGWNAHYAERAYRVDALEAALREVRVIAEALGEDDV